MRCLHLLLSVSLFRSLSGENGNLSAPWACSSGFALPVFLHKAVCRPPVEQISPDKNVNFSASADPPEADTTQPQHLLPAQHNTGTGSSTEPRASLCCANLSRIYSGLTRRLGLSMLFLFVGSQLCHRLRLKSPYCWLQTKPHDSALVFGLYFC